VAYKCFEFIDATAQTEDEILDGIKREIRILQRLDCPQLMKFYGLVLDPLTSMIALVLELVDGQCLVDVVRNLSHELSWPTMLNLSQDIAKGLEYLHSLKPPIIHRDLKSPNIIMTSAGRSPSCKIIDFGTGVEVRGPVLGRPVANPIWQAPEILQKLPYDQSVDTYAYAVVLWEIVARSKPYDHLAFMTDIQEFVCEGGRPTIPYYVPSTYQQIITACWATTPSSRPSFPTILTLLDNCQHDKPAIPTYLKALKKQQIAEARKQMLTIARKKAVLPVISACSSRPRRRESLADIVPFQLLHESTRDSMNTLSFFLAWIKLNYPAYEKTVSFHISFQLIKEGPPNTATFVLIADEYLGWTFDRPCEFVSIHLFISALNIVNRLPNGFDGPDLLSYTLFNDLMEKVETQVLNLYENFTQAMLHPKPRGSGSLPNAANWTSPAFVKQQEDLVERLISCALLDESDAIECRDWVAWKAESARKQSTNS